MNSSSTASITLELIVGDRIDIKKYIKTFVSKAILKHTINANAVA